MYSTKICYRNNLCKVRNQPVCKCKLTRQSEVDVPYTHTHFSKAHLYYDKQT